MNLNLNNLSPIKPDNIKSIYKYGNNGFVIIPDKLNEISEHLISSDFKFSTIFYHSNIDDRFDKHLIIYANNSIKELYDFTYNLLSIYDGIGMMLHNPDNTDVLIPHSSLSNIPTPINIEDKLSNNLYYYNKPLNIDII